jgi:hypothetical protein
MADNVITRHITITEPWPGELHQPSPDADGSNSGDVNAGARTGVLVLSGSSGRIESERARIFAEHGMSALTIRYFGGPGQPPGICEVPLETFTAGIDLLQAEGAQRIGIIGVSKGAEAALLTAIRDPRVDAVIALSPTAYVWNNVGPGSDGVKRPYRSCWTWRGEPVPFVPFDDYWLIGREDGEAPVPIVGWYEQSERTFADALEAAAIPAELTRAQLVLVAGGDDAMWSSLRYAETLAERRRAAGMPVDLVSRADAGHRTRLPGESPAQPETVYAYGGTHAADVRLGTEAWPVILRALRGPATEVGS